MEHQILKFEEGQRVITPEGEGEVIEIKGNQIKVKLNTGMIKDFPTDKVSDDSQLNNHKKLNLNIKS